MDTNEAVARARSWASNPRVRPESATVRSAATLLVEHIDKLTKIATGEITHVHNGMCPDALEGPLVRDPDCPACQILQAAELTTS